MGAGGAAAAESGSFQQDEEASCRQRCMPWWYYSEGDAAQALKGPEVSPLHGESFRAIACQVSSTKFRMTGKLHSPLQAAQVASWGRARAAYLQVQEHSVSQPW